MRIQIRSHRSQMLQHGQSTVEFMLMVPVLFSMLFFVIEMGLYFSSVHYGTYAAFATARSQEVGFSPSYPSASAVSELILSGDVWTGDNTFVNTNASGKAVGIAVRLQSFETLVPFPFINALLPDMTFDTTVNLGPNECQYEYAVDQDRPSDQYDNNVNPASCN